MEQEVPSTFDSFYRDEYAAVVAVVKGLSGNQWVAEEVAQEAFLRAYTNWSRVEGFESPRHWVRHVALNLARSRFRKLRAEAVALTRLRSAGDSVEAPDDPFELFWREVRRLPPRQAQVIALRYIEDMPLVDIAVILGLAEGTVKALLHQGRTRLGHRLKAKGLLDNEA
jgi:RNA polymerase sigma-70 factor, ECF subfamily